MINLNYQYKLKLNRQQEREIDLFLDVCKSVYNYALKERKDWINSRKSLINSCSIISEYIIAADTPYPNYNNQAKSLTEAKKNYILLQSVHNQVLQQTLKTLDKAFTDMKSRNFGFPRFKKEMRSFLFPALSKYCLGIGEIKLPHLGLVKIRQSRPFPTGFEAKQARIVKKASGYYVVICFQSQEQIPDFTPGKISIGLDVGIESFVATSLGELIKCPRFLLKAQRKLKLLQRRLKHKTKGSKNWLKLQNKIAKVHETVANIRKDWHFKLANYLCSLTDNIFVEDINFVSWSKGIFRKKSLDRGIGQFINQILPFVCFKQGKYFAKVDKNHTSQTCPNCNSHTGKKTLGQRIHHCQHCGHTESRDTAAAKVIRDKGLNAVGHTVLKNACGDVLTGVKQLNLFDLVKNL